MQDNMKGVYRSLFGTYEYILDFIIPRSCAGCSKEHEAFCAKCRAQSFQKYFGCLMCGARNYTGSFCAGSCRKKTPLVLKRVFWAGCYDDALKDALWQLKYKKRREIAKPLGKLLAEKFLMTPYAKSTSSCAVIFIPLHPNREKERGFNQAEYIAKSFAEATGVDIAYHALSKKKETLAQVHAKDRAERQTNLDSAFEVNKSAFAPHRNKTIIMIDDVATTGATLFHASRVLADAGATKIIGLVVAHGA